MVYDVIIIGLGASGVSAAIYAKRSGLNVCVINLSTPGGIISESSIVENYPGITSISGTDLAYQFFEHFNSLDVPLYNEEVIDIIDGDTKKVVTTNNSYEAKNVIICSGRKPKKLGLELENRYIGNGISYCAVCDGNLYKNKITCVIGGGNSALESVLYLSNICEYVYLLVRKDKTVADESLVKEAKSKDNIKIMYETEIKKLIINDSKIVGVKTNKEDLKVDGIFVNIGYEPSIGILKSLNIEMDNNYIIVDKNMETNIKGIFACGDIIKKDLYQLVTAVSDGAIAANYISKKIRNGNKN
ncbi:MAG: FAD-dependent oxidoreductase [Bacilli bacterium]|nr:FAD-dependent oxidoreductase [Bacilli bacterium]